MTQYSVLPRSVRAHESARAAVIRSLLVWVAQAWSPNRAMDPAVWFERFADDYATRVTLSQIEVALLASWSVEEALRLQGAEMDAPGIAVDQLASTNGAGRPVMGQAYASAGVVGGAVAWAEQSGEDTALALAKAWKSAGLSLAVATQTMVSDASRAAKSVAMTARDTGWVRVLTPPSCARCAVLGGKYFRNPTAGFDRHPGCDCTQMPVPGRRSELAQKLMVEPRDYFDTLTSVQQDRIFTKAGAQAIRDGADINQVVNARRGMAKATDIVARRRDTTDEGITKRGWAYQYLRPAYEAHLRKEPGYRYRRLDTRRLMPERIYELAGGDTDTAVMLLHANGFLTDASPRLRGTQSWFPRDADVALATERARAKLRARGVTPRN